MNGLDLEIHSGGHMVDTARLAGQVGLDPDCLECQELCAGDLPIEYRADAVRVTDQAWQQVPDANPGPGRGVLNWKIVPSWLAEAADEVYQSEGPVGSDRRFCAVNRYVDWFALASHHPRELLILDEYWPSRAGLATVAELRRDQAPDASAYVDLAYRGQGIFEVVVYAILAENANLTDQEKIGITRHLRSATSTDPLYGNRGGVIDATSSDETRFEWYFV